MTVITNMINLKLYNEVKQIMGTGNTYNDFCDSRFDYSRYDEYCKRIRNERCKCGGVELETLASDDYSEMCALIRMNALR